jgi:hypothetical protein
MKMERGSFSEDIIFTGMKTSKEGHRTSLKRWQSS